MNWFLVIEQLQKEARRLQAEQQGVPAHQIAASASIGAAALMLSGLSHALLEGMTAPSSASDERHQPND